ncbi:MAG: DNA/RNA non-specific endonuclease [Saprospiraceae bacterium]|nr:DNA/RNA non-specific endonuclease [Saprospiraceae bacterium]MDW8228774.1 DNA/RNA non-specific endonuclease [Saprospiraceae bacterium]
MRTYRHPSSADDGIWFKTGLFALLAGLAFWIFQQFGGDKKEESLPKVESPREAPATCRVPEDILPTSTTGAVVRHTYYVLSYSEDHEQAEWVAYELLRERLQQPWVERFGAFRPDPDVRTESATPRDYSGSGYDRGHLVPAADMAFDAKAMDETFFMSNISPQVRTFNGGVWRELEENIRDWAKRMDVLYVVTGPVLTRPGLGQIGFNRVTVPSAFYKVIYAPQQRNAIGFVIPNAMSDRPLLEYACSVDEVEKITGIDFFLRLLRGAEERLEADADKTLWPTSSRRYERRLREWNRE